ncbi:MAG: hypothetical protein FWC71_04025 [Defluviitaleaceae bacterium]|nr:hypothetical protein [Defluviitaleaceae bacterium]
MNACKNYKANDQAAVAHHRNPMGDCAGCVYFSKQNCRSHTPSGGENAIPVAPAYRYL